MDAIKQFTDEIVQLIAKDQMKMAIQKVQTLLKGNPLFDDFVLQSARYNDVMKSIRNGVINFEEASIEKNKIRYALMDILRELEESTETNAALKTEVKTFLQEKQPKIINKTVVKGDGNINIQGSSGNSININR